MTNLRRLLLLLACTACDPDCPDPDEMDGGWTMTMTVLQHEGGDAAAFPSYRTPVNGTLRWAFQWGDLPEGPVAVDIGGARLDGEGTWDQDSCGAFQIAVAGPYDSPSGSRHVLEATLDGVYWDGLMDGRVRWSEDWTDREGEQSGSFTASGRFEAVRE